MRNLLLFILSIFLSVSVFGQKWNTNFMKPDSTWGVEEFHFPIKFAKKIEYKGVELALFPKGWINTDSSTFWTYVFVWNINLDGKLTVKDLEKNLEMYFNGLSADVNKEPKKILPKTKAVFKKTDSVENPHFIGKVRIYDSFVTRDTLVLHSKVEQYYCEKEKKSYITFRFSPKEFNHKVWKRLEKVSIKNNACEL